MSVGVTNVGARLGGSSPSRYRLQCPALGLTGRDLTFRCRDSVVMVTKDDIDGDKFRYRIEVQGYPIEECYEYDEPKSEGEVAKDWLSDVRNMWGDAMADNFQGAVEANKLWQTTTQDCSEDEPIALGPPPLDDDKEE
jgi:hypothetical protein